MLTYDARHILLCCVVLRSCVVFDVAMPLDRKSIVTSCAFDASALLHARNFSRKQRANTQLSALSTRRIVAVRLRIWVEQSSHADVVYCSSSRACLMSTLNAATTAVRDVLHVTIPRGGWIGNGKTPDFIETFYILTTHVYPKPCLPRGPVPLSRRRYPHLPPLVQLYPP